MVKRRTWLVLPISIVAAILSAQFLISKVRILEDECKTLSYERNLTFSSVPLLSADFEG
jgi:hypothetical protein